MDIKKASYPDFKNCNRCGRTALPITSFRIKNKERGWRASECNDCHVSLEKKDRYKPERLAKSEATRIIRREKFLKFIYDYLLAHPCVDCGEKNPLVLQFDHVRGVKYKAISQMISGGCDSMNSLLEEISKCEIRCANCHTLKTAKERQWKMWEWWTQNIL